MELSVIIPTHNRSEELRKTLEGLLRTRKDGLSLNVIIMDNGGTDKTRDVVKHFEDKLDISYFYEPKPGKSRALNWAIKHTRLGEVIIFTDDDVDPSIDWLIEICASCHRWPSHFVFGGRINVILPDGKIPSWVSDYDPFINSFVFGGHHVAEQDCLYKDGQTPFGAHFWLRKEILEKGYLFDERIGPGNGLMGEDSAFLLNIANDGYPIMYIPRAVIGHRVGPELFQLTNIWRRAFIYGRSQPYLFGISNYSLFKKNKKVWQAYMIGAIFWNLLKVIPSLCLPRKQRISKIAKEISWAGNHYESLITMYKKKPNLE